MPRDGSGVFSPPAGTTATAGTTIESAKYNAFVNDLVTDANTARPIVAGGTGATTAGAALAALGGQPLDAGLTSIAGLTTAADRMIYTTAADTYAVATLTAAGRALLDDADAAAQLVTLGAQAADATLTSLAGLSLVAGDILYATGADTLVRLPKGTAGQVLQMNTGATAPGWVTLRQVFGPFSTATGTQVDVTDLPAWASEIAVHFWNVSGSSTGRVIVQLGNAASGIVSTGYDGRTSEGQLSSGLPIHGSTASDVRTGTMTLRRIPGASGDAWVETSVIASGTTSMGTGAGISGEISAVDRLRVTLTSGNFDSGQFWVEAKA